MKVRRAVSDDIARMVELMDARRQLYQTFQPTFWRNAPNARPAQASFFASLVGSESAIVLVCEEHDVFRGFVIAILTEAPPVYAPGGKTCLIDDFAVAQGDWNDSGRALLREAQRIAKEAGAVQTVVVCGHLDEPKRGFLRAEGLSIASEWYVGNL